MQVQANVTLDFTDPRYRSDPYPLLKQLREHDPVHRHQLGMWIITRHADCSALNRDARLGRDLRKWSGYTRLWPYGHATAFEASATRWMLNLDAPDHTRLRQLVMKAFTRNALEATVPKIAAIADELLDGLKNSDEVELMSDFARPFPIRVIAALTGLPVSDEQTLRAWSDAIAVAVEPARSAEANERADAAVVAMNGYLREVIQERRLHLSDDLLSSLILAEEDGDRLNEEELIATLVLLFVAGHETTTNLIGNGMLALAQHTDQWQQLRMHAELIPLAVEEMARYESPVNINARVAHADVVVGDKRIRPGELVYCMLGAANHDPEVFVEADRFDVSRQTNPHLTFGGGPHYCLGAPLARLETRVALERIIERWPAVELGGEFRWRSYINLRGLEELPLRIVR